MSNNNITGDFKPISVRIHDPNDSVFKTKGSDRADVKVVSCCFPECPLKRNGFCIRIGFLSDRCVYGKVSSEEGPTKRSKTCRDWVRSVKERYKSLIEVTYQRAPEKMAFIGDYVYFPYMFANLCKEVGFVEHGSLFSTGTCFIHRDLWDMNTIRTLIDFKPQALMGGEITDYQKKSVPLFLAHLREVDPEKWGQLVKERPNIDKAPNYVGRKALLRTLNSPIEWTTGKKYPVTWKYDGNTVVTTSKNAYDSTWGDIPLSSVTVSGTPDKNAVVTVQSNEWVNEKTVFID